MKEITYRGTTAGARTKPEPNEKNDADALRHLKQAHGAPCGDPKCDSAYCYVAERLVSLRRQLAEREQELAILESTLRDARRAFVKAERLGYGAIPTPDGCSWVLVTNDLLAEFGTENASDNAAHG